MGYSCGSHPEPCLRASAGHTSWCWCTSPARTRASSPSLSGSLRHPPSSESSVSSRLEGVLCPLSCLFMGVIQKGRWNRHPIYWGCDAVMCFLEEGFEQGSRIPASQALTNPCSQKQDHPPYQRENS